MLPQEDAGRYTMLSYGEGKSVEDIQAFVDRSEEAPYESIELQDQITSNIERSKGILSFVNQLIAMPAAGAISLGTATATQAAERNANRANPVDEEWTEAYSRELKSAMDKLTYVPKGSPEAAEALRVLNKPFEVLEEWATIGGETVQDVLTKYADGTLGKEAATAVHTAVMMLPALLLGGIARKGGMPKAVEGELLPRETNIPGQDIIPGQRQGVVIKGGASTEALPPPAETPLQQFLKGPKREAIETQRPVLLEDQQGKPSGEMQVSPEGVVRDTSNYEQGIFDKARQERTDLGLTPDIAIAQQKAIRQSENTLFEIDKEIVETSPPRGVARIGDTLPQTIQKYSEMVDRNNAQAKSLGKEAGQLNLQEIQDGITELARIADDSIILNKIRLVTQPLQTGTPETSAIVKNFANNMAAIGEKKNQRAKELKNIAPTEVDEVAMLKAHENPSLEATLTPEQRAMVSELREIFEETLGPLAVDMGLLSGIRKDYAKHVAIDYLNDSSINTNLFGETIVRNWLKTGRRKYETFEEGEAAGVEYLKRYGVMIAAAQHLEAAIYGKQFVNWVKSQEVAGEALVSLPGENIPGYVTVNHPAFRQTTWHSSKHITVGKEKVWVNDNAVQYKGKEYLVINNRVYLNDTSYKVQKSVYSSSRNIKVHPKLAGPLKALLEADTPNIFIDSFMKLKSASMQLIMYNPMFHNTTVFFKVVPSLPQMGLGNLISPREIVGEEVWKNLTPVAKVLARTPFIDYVVGNYLNNNKAMRIYAIKHNDRFLGGKGYKMDLYGDIDVFRNSMLDLINPKLGKMADKAADFWHGYLLWDRIGDLQMGLFHRFTLSGTKTRVAEFEKSNGRKPTVQELEAMKEASAYEAGEISNLIAGAFGREDFAAGWRRFLNLGLFSRSYTFSNLRLAQAGMGALPKHVIGQVARALDGKATINKGMFQKIATTMLLKDLFLLFSTLEIGNYIITKKYDIPDEKGTVGGHFSWDNEPAKKMKIAVGVKSNGQVVYMGTPFRAARDIYELMFSWALSPKEFKDAWGNKLSPFVSTAIDVKKNENFRGDTIMKDGDDWWDNARDVSLFMAKGLTGFETTMGTFNPGEQTENIARLFGAQISHGSPGGPLIGSYREIERNQAAREKDALREAMDMMRHGKETEAIQMLADLGFSSSELESESIRHESGGAAFMKNFKMHIEKMYSRATPEQRKRLRELEGN